MQNCVYLNLKLQLVKKKKNTEIYLKHLCFLKPKRIGNVIIKHDLLENQQTLLFT